MLKKCATALTLLASATIFLSHCAHSQKAAVNRLQISMTKSEVLDIAGNPNHTGRKLGSDVWLYVYGEEGSAQKTEVIFQEGKVSYIGEPREQKAPSNAETKSGKDFRPIGDK